MNLIITEMLTRGWTKASLPQTSLYKTAKMALIRRKMSETLQTHLSLIAVFRVSLCPFFCQTHTHTLSSEPGSLLGCWLLTQGGLMAELNDGWNRSVRFESWRTVKPCLAHTQSSHTCPSLIRGHSCGIGGKWADSLGHKTLLFKTSISIIHFPSIIQNNNNNY